MAAGADFLIHEGLTMSTREDAVMQLCTAALQGIGTVRASMVDGRLYEVETAHGRLSARQAVSCLLVPQPGDRVWLSGDIDQGIYVLAVLERDNSAPAQLQVPVDTTIAAARGTLTLQAATLKLTGAQVAVQADSAVLSAQKVCGVGHEASWSFSRIKVMADLFESFADRVVQFARWSQRTVEGMDQLRSRQIDYRAEQTLQLQAETLVANASKLAKVDGEQIHFG